MAGIKKRKGVQVKHSKYFYKGKEYKPCMVVCKKVFGNGYKKMLSANSIEDGSLILNQNNRPMPWQHIPWD